MKQKNLILRLDRNFKKGIGYYLLIIFFSSWIIPSNKLMCKKNSIKNQVVRAIEKSEEYLYMTGPINISKVGILSPEVDLESDNEIKYIVELLRHKGDYEKIVLYYDSKAKLIMIYRDSSFSKNMKLFDFLPSPIYKE